MPDRSIAQKTLQIARIVHFALLFAAVAYIAMPLLVDPKFSHRPEAGFILAFGVAALPPVGVAAFYRIRVVQAATEALRQNADDTAAATRWRQGVIVSLVCCESIVLFGLALRFMGGSWSVCAIFYSVGIFLLLTWTPRLEPPPT